MTPLESPAVATLAWTQPKWSIDRYELRAGEEALGELYWTRWISDRAIGRYGETTWIFDRCGFFRSRGVVLERDSQLPTARFTFDWVKDGNLVLADGRAYRWYRTKVFDTTWALAEETGEVVYEIWLGMRWFKRQGTVRLCPGEKAIPELGLLLCLGMYLSICTLEDVAVATAATTAAVV